MNDPVLVGSTILKDLALLLMSVTIETWSRERRVFDLSLDNVLIDLSARPRIAVRQAIVAAIEGDDIEGALLVPDQTALLERIDAWLLRDTALRLIDGLRSVVRVGQRHLWGNFAVGIADAALRMANRDPSTRADEDRDLFFASHADLAAHVELIAVPDGLGSNLTFAIRHNCCLRFKLPDVPICVNCNLLGRDECIKQSSERHVPLRLKTREAVDKQERARNRRDVGAGDHQLPPGPRPLVHVEPLGVEFEVEPGETIIEAAWRLGYDWPTRCYGMAECTYCAVEVVGGGQNLSPVEEEEKGVLEHRMTSFGPDLTRFRLACRAQPTGEVTVRREGVGRHPDTG
jgi:2Fe-2S ferredoxin